MPELPFTRAFNRRCLSLLHPSHLHRPSVAKLFVIDSFVASHAREVRASPTAEPHAQAPTCASLTRAILSCVPVSCTRVARTP
ncbi:hypothetical protein IC582_001543 [Cucumis melo]